MRARAFLGLLFLTALLLAPILPPVEASGEGSPYHSWEKKGGWLLLETDVVGLAISLRLPFFAWWYVKDNSTIYVAHYRGLIEYYDWPERSLLEPYSWADALARELIEEASSLEEALTNANALVGQLVSGIEILHTPVDPDDVDALLDIAGELVQALNTIYSQAVASGDDLLAQQVLELNSTLTEVIGLLEELRENPRDHTLLHQLKRKASKLRGAWEHLVADECWCKLGDHMKKIEDIVRRGGHEVKLLHPPYFSFAEGRWEVEGPEDIVADGEVIGLWFAYKLVEVYNPAFDFLEGNLLIRCRLYYVPVREVAAGGELNYTVLKAELKQDIVISSWRWNREIASELEEELGLQLWLANASSGLALRLDLLALNATDVEDPAGFCEEMKEPSDEGEVISLLVREARRIRSNITCVCEEINQYLSSALGELNEGAGVEEIQDELGSALLAVGKALLFLTFHKEMVKSIDERAQEELSQEAYSALSEVINDLLEEVDEAIGFFEELNETIAGISAMEDPGEAALALQGAISEVKSFKEEFKEDMDEIIEQLEGTLHEHGADVSRHCRSTHARIGGEDVDIRDDERLEREKRLMAGVGLKNYMKIGFLSENTTLAGWFRFVNASIITCPDGRTEIRPVELAYLEANRTLHLFLLYGDFGSCRLEHDPSVGLDVPETSDQEPAYTLEAPSGENLAPQLIPGGIGTGILLPKLEYIAVAVIGLVVLAAVVLAYRRKSRTINLY